MTEESNRENEERLPFESADQGGHADDQADVSHMRDQQGQVPSPPSSWNPNVQPPQIAHDASSSDKVQVENAGQPGRLSQEEALLFGEARKFITAAEIMSIVSLIVGGVVLSGASLVVAILGYRKLSAIAANHREDAQARTIVLRPGIIAIGMAALALGLNAAALMALYPMIMSALQSGDYTSLMPGTAAPPTSSGAAIDPRWG